MIIEFEGNTAGHLFEEGLHKFRIHAVKEATRNGPAMVMPELAVFTLNDPTKRVIDDPVRNANPFFHLMEFVWMTANRCDVGWISQFNEQMKVYADDDILRAAYGYRWESQPWLVIKLLIKEPTTRQAVIQLWQSYPDLTESYKDKACNVTIMFRNNRGALDMLVANRSNDFVWGALGANVCHFTMLHECISHFSGIPMGRYTVVSNNLHMYIEQPKFNDLWKTVKVEEIYDRVKPEPMFLDNSTYSDFKRDCISFCCGKNLFMSRWITGVANPAYRSWEAYKKGDFDKAILLARAITAPDWRIACLNWLERKKQKTLSSAT